MSNFMEWFISLQIIVVSFLTSKPFRCGLNVIIALALGEMGNSKKVHGNKW